MISFTPFDNHNKTADPYPSRQLPEGFGLIGWAFIWVPLGYLFVAAIYFGVRFISQ